MTIRSLTCLIAFAALCQNGPALAQPAPPAPAAEPVGPNLPTIADPMLDPLPAPKRTLTSWQQALKLVRTRSTNLRSTLAQVKQATGVARQALSRALPTLTAQASVNRHLLFGEGPVPPFDQFPLRTGSIPEPATTWQAGLAFRAPLFAPRVWHDTATAREAIEAAKLSGAEVERLLLGSVAEAIVSVVTAERLLEVSRVSLSSALSTLDLNKRRAQLGAATALDVLRVEQEVALARAQILNTAEGLLRAREALGLALGTTESWGVTPRIQLDALANDAANTCRLEQSIDARPDVRAARANASIARRNVESVDYDYYPTLDFVSNLNYSPHDQFTANREHVTWTIGATLTWQIYDGGQRYGERIANVGRVELAQQELTQARRQAALEVGQARRAVQVSQANLEVSKRSRDVASETSRLAQIAFINGSGTSFDLVDSARRLREAELDLAIREFDLIRAKIAALLALATCDI
jgi:outer membrane protein TolC